ncbi:hypothetical protein BDY19DRAFT_881003, partial [Irpex rosettiformis]
MIRQSNLRGFEIPNAPERKITSLFADDTTILLSEHDNYTILENILDTWCLASGGKFNKDKTIAIPIGNSEYRQKVLTTRKIGEHSLPLPQDISLIPDGEATRSLGAWIGNNTNAETPWSPVLNKINSALTRWNKFKPTLKGKRLIVQMIVAGMTQYLTKVQGMPKTIELQLKTIIRDFMWDKVKIPPINLETLQQPLQKGGLKLIDLTARNEAIEIAWLATYLRRDDERPTWTYLADYLISRSVIVNDRHIPIDMRINAFTQTWKTSTHHTSTLPECLKRMLKTAIKYNANFTAIKLSHKMQRNLPIWLH